MLDTFLAYSKMQWEKRGICQFPIRSSERSTNYGVDCSDGLPASKEAESPSPISSPSFNLLLFLELVKKFRVGGAVGVNLLKCSAYLKLNDLSNHILIIEL